MSSKRADRLRTPKNLRLETLRESHIPQILEIERQANPAPWSERSFRHEIGHRHGIFLVASTSSGVVGYGGCWLVIDECHITNVAVDPAMRRQGIGEHLMRELLARALQRGMTCSTLECRAGNEAAIRLYEKLGYVLAARRRAYYPDNSEDAVVMWLYDLARLVEEI